MSVIDGELNINLNSPGSALALFAIAVLSCFLIYRSRTKIGFYLRKRWPIYLGKESVAQTKNVADVLFIDDNDSPVATTLASDGYRVDTARDGQVHQQKTKRANIIFVDFKGVGKKISSEQQGIALANVIKKEYGHRKFVILYSAQEYVEPSGSLADAWIKKGESTTEYAEMIRKACFTLYA